MIKINKWVFLPIVIVVSIIAGYFLGFISLAKNPTTRPNLTQLAYGQEQSPLSPNDIRQFNSFQKVFNNVSEKVLPSVVQLNVITLKESSNRPGGSPWDFFFGNPKNGDDDNNRGQYRSSNLGSGIIVNKKGNTFYVLTNNHVVEDSENIQVTTYDNKNLSGKLIGNDSRVDLALLSFEGEKGLNIQVAELGDSDRLQIGDWVMAVGSPYGLQSSVTAGIVSFIGRQGGPEGNINDFIQTDAAINHGNSGGALVNMQGELVGINTWISSESGANAGIGFAIPINNTTNVVEDFMKNGEIKYGWLGVSIQDLGDMIAPISGSDEEKKILTEMGIYGKTGAFVGNVFTNSPAARAGIQAGDFIYELNGEKIIDKSHLTYRVGFMRPNEEVEMKLIRNNAEISIRVKITERASEKDVAKDVKIWPGVVVLPISERIIQNLSNLEDTPKGQKGLIVLSVTAKAPLQIAGIKNGDIITQINGVKVETLSEFYREINNQESKKVSLTFVRSGETLDTPSITRK